MKKCLHCEKCILALSDCKDGNNYCSLIKSKSRGLIIPSSDVIDVCITCEKFFRKYVFNANSSTVSRIDCHDIVQSVLKVYLHKNIFATLAEHMVETYPLCNHVVLLIKAVAEKYLQVRYYYAGRQFSAQQIEKRQTVSRQVSNKLVLFQGL